VKKKPYKLLSKVQFVFSGVTVDSQGNFSPEKVWVYDLSDTGGVGVLAEYALFLDLMAVRQAKVRHYKPQLIARIPVMSGHAYPKYKKARAK